jgi:uncharacterized membrane protein YphA (DoxX/SURF4 family)
MFHADHSAIVVVAYGLVACLFIGAGLANATSRVRTDQHVAQFAALGLPFPRLILYCGYAMQFVGGFLVLIDWHADAGAIILIVFTIAAMLAFHHYWRMSDPARRNTARLFFLNNCGVLGGLALIAEPALSRLWT